MQLLTDEALQQSHHEHCLAVTKQTNVAQFLEDDTPGV